MQTVEKIKVFKSDTPEYHHAFQVFLDHTDQKDKAKEYLENCISRLLSRCLFIDVGAGNGKVTRWLTNSFQQTIAMEPNESLRAELIKACPKAKVFKETILEAPMTEKADFILVSHVLYYIAREEWLVNLERLASWLSPEGMLIVIVQNHETDCMKMLQHFLGQSFDLRILAENFQKQVQGKYDVQLEIVPSQIKTRDFKSAAMIAEFMLNLLPLDNVPARQDVEAYVEKNFAVNGGYRFSCDQHFLKIRLQAG